MMKMLNVPTHIGVILDGNRRFAREMLKRPWEGHRIGLEKARDFLKWSCEAGIKYMTAYVLSFENLGTRPKTELKYILKYLEGEADAILTDSRHVVHRFDVRVRFIGRIHLLPAALQSKLAAVEVKTGRKREALPGMAEFRTRYPHARALLVGKHGIPVQEFLLTQADTWL